MNNHRSTLSRSVGVGLLAFFFCSLAQLTLAQNASRWRVYKTADGLDDSLCTTVTAGATNIWISHFQNGFVTRFDGYRMQKLPAPGIGPYRIQETADGELWTVSGEGVQEFRNQKWVQYTIPEVRALGPTDSFAQLRLVSIAPLEKHRLLVCSPQGLLEFKKEGSKTVSLKLSAETELKKFADMSPVKSRGVWIAGAKGIAHVQEESGDTVPHFSYQEFLPPQNLGLENFQHPFPDNRGGVIVVADSTSEQKRVGVWFDGKRWKVFKIRERVKLAWRDAEGVFWAMTSTALFRGSDSGNEFTEEQELSVGQFLDAAVGPGGLMWIATSEGLFCRVPLPWRTPSPLKSLNGRVHAIIEDDQDRLWIASNVGLHCYEGEKLENFPYPENFEGYFRPSDALFLLGKKKLIMNGGDRVLQFDLQTKSFSLLTYPNDARIKILGWLKEGVLCVQLLQSPHQKNQLLSYDGRIFTPIADLPDVWNPASELSSFLVAQNNDWWVGGGDGVALFQNGSWKTFPPDQRIAPDNGFSLAETIDGRIWCGGSERMWEFNGKSWAAVRGGFDRVNNILKRPNGTYWVASNNGLRGLNNGDWLLNSVADGLANTAVISVFEDKKRRIWAGTAHGVSLRDAAADLDAPVSSVEMGGDVQNGTPKGTVTFNFQAQDRWRITQAERLLYSYRLDEQDWTPWGPRDFVAFSELASGKHVFQLRAIDRNWNITAKPAVLEFAITLPWYQETRLILIALTGCGIALFFAVLAYNRHRKLVRSYAEIEKIVALRTQQLEKANRELLHSQKMTALGTLSAGIAHDFNNILSIIKGSAQIIETSMGDTEKIQTRINRIKTVVEQGSGIVKAMLGFSRTSEKQLSLCHVNGIVEDTLKLLGDRFLREVDIQFQPKSNLPQVAVSKEFIQQILLNFIFNAADAFDGPGKIVVRTGRLEQLTDYIALQPATASEYLLIAVEDFGSGIAPETMPRIFEPFFTTKAFSARRGTGLGLSMVYELAKEMGAGLTVKSEVGKGSVFTLVLPLLPQGKSQPMD